MHTRSKAVEQALGWVAQKMGFCDCIVPYLVVTLNEVSVFQDSHKDPQPVVNGVQVYSKLNVQMLPKSRGSTSLYGIGKLIQAG